MTISKKHSRKITVGDTEFIWAISANKGYIVFIAEHKTEKGSRIEVYMETDINDYWINFPNVENLNLRIIKPKDVALIISQAIENGWNPCAKGSPIQFDWKHDLLTKR